MQEQPVSDMKTKKEKEKKGMKACEKYSVEEKREEGESEKDRKIYKI